MRQNSRPTTVGNPEQFQFITNGDLFIGGNVNADDPSVEEGQIFVKEQMHMHGNPSFQGRIIVQNESNVLRPRDRKYDRWHAEHHDTRARSRDIRPRPATTTYTNNFSGWIEQ